MDIFAKIDLKLPLLILNMLDDERDQRWPLVSSSIEGLSSVHVEVPADHHDDISRILYPLLHLMNVPLDWAIANF